MTKRTITLNCDMGESFGSWEMGCDKDVMPYVDLTNIACGFHASDPHIMSQTIDLAIKYGTQIGAHPGYPDLQGFGRRSMSFSPVQLTELLIYQVGALNALCQSKNTQIEYVKPHGALYNDMMSNLGTFEAVVDAVSCFGVPLMMLAITNNDQYLAIADRYDVPLLFEAFADRAYTRDGMLAKRSIEGAVFTSEDDILGQVSQIAHYGKVKTIDGYFIHIEADTICVHGDNLAAVKMIEKISEVRSRQ